MQQQVGDARLLQGRLERLDQLVWQLADEPDRVGDQIATPGVLVGPGGRVEGVKQPLSDAHAGSGERVEQRRLAGVRIAGERHRRHRRRLSPGAHHAPISLHADEPAAQRGDPVAGEAAIGLDLRLARTPGPDAAVDPPGAEALEVGPQAAHPGEVVLELRELDLQLALGRVGMVGEDVEDDRGAVDHRHVQFRLEVALLPRRELVVAGDQVRPATLDLALQLGELAAAEVAVGVGLRPHLHELAGDRHAGGPQQFLELDERVALGDGLGGRRDPDRQRTLPRAGVSNPRGGTVVSARGWVSVAARLHPAKSTGGPGRTVRRPAPSARPRARNRRAPLHRRSGSPSP